MYLTLILGLLSLVERASETLPKLVAAAKRESELTPEQDAELDARMAAAFASPAWKTDEQRDAGA